MHAVGTLPMHVAVYSEDKAGVRNSVLLSNKNCINYPWKEFCFLLNPVEAIVQRYVTGTEKWL